MKKSKIVSIFAVILTLAVVMTISLTGCSNSKYFEEISSYTFWANKGNEAISQTHIYDMVMDHINSENGKAKKVLLLGFDGMRADAIVNIRQSGVKDENGNDIYSGDNINRKNSAINHIVDDMGGKMYIAYCGGDNKDTFQATSTAPGWAALTSGSWGKQNGVVDNNMVKNLEKKTFMLELAEKGYKSLFTASWNEHFELTYSKEIEHIANNNLPMAYINCDNDDQMHQELLSAVTVGSEKERDIIFCIYERPDNNGHYNGFSNENNGYVSAVKNSDQYMYEIISAVESRATYDSEDWLIILTADHGGKGKGHGLQNAESRTTFIITNKDMGSKYYSKNYDGLKENN